MRSSLLLLRIGVQSELHRLNTPQFTVKQTRRTFDLLSNMILSDTQVPVLVNLVKVTKSPGGEIIGLILYYPPKTSASSMYLLI